MSKLIDTWRNLRFRHKFMVGGSLAVLAALLGAASFYGVMGLSVKGGTVTMPELKGLPKAAAEIKLQSLGLDMQVREERYDPSAPFGAVLEQSLEAGASLKRGRTIAVVLSIGQKILKVPQLVGSASSRQARLLLEQNGLSAGRLAWASDPLAPRDTVLAQSPEAGIEASRGQAVSLLVSAGPREVARSMPDLRGRSLDEARAIAQRAGLVLRKVAEAPSLPVGAVAGSVLSQSLTPAARVKALLRRREPAPSDDDELRVGDLRADVGARRVWVGEEEVSLSRREFDLLRALLERPGRAVTRDRLFDEVWADEVDINSNALDVHVSRVRARIGAARSVRIVTLRGVGYRPGSVSHILGRNLWIYGVGGLIAPFIGIKLIDLVIGLIPGF